MGGEVGWTWSKIGGLVEDFFVSRDVTTAAHLCFKQRQKMKNSALNRTTLQLWEDCIEMIGPGEAPLEQYFTQPMADLRPVRMLSRNEAPKARAASTNYLQKFASKTKTPVAGFL